MATDKGLEDVPEGKFSLDFSLFSLPRACLRPAMRNLLGRQAGLTDSAIMTIMTVIEKQRN